jgi:hypothetical protein
MKTTQSSSWPDLQPELLGLVLKRLPILTDRVRLRAVCWPWRSNARLQALPPLNPCLILRDGSFLSIPGGEIIRMPEQYDGRCCGIIDNWLFLVKSDGGFSLVDPFSKATVDLSKIPMGSCDPYQYKLVVSSPLDSSPDSPVAVMFLDDGGYTTIGICQPPIAFNFYRGEFLDHFHALIDVTFFDGKFYGLDFGDKLLTFEVSYSYGRGSKPKISSVKNVINSMDNIPDLPNPKPLPERAYVASRYLVECCGRLLMVRQWLVIPLTLEHARTASFEVFEADLSTKPNQWRRVQNLGGQALFVGGRRSKSFPAGEGNGIQEDCIYFMCDYFPSHFAANPLGDSGVYNITDGMITPLFSETATVSRHQRGQWSLTWYFPADAV